MQHDFQYIPKHSPEVRESYDKLMSLLSDVREYLREDYTFQHRIVGSYSHNMMTHDVKSNVGFDFDVNIYPNDEEERFSAKDLKTSFKKALDRFAPKYGFDYAEDSTRVLTIKVKDFFRSRVIYSVDFCIVHDYTDETGADRQQYIRFNKEQNSYYWADQSQGYYMLPDKIYWLKDHQLWNDEFLNLYIWKKNNNDDPHVHSRTIFAQTVHEFCVQNGYCK